MANPIQLDLFANPPDDFDCQAGFFSRDVELFQPTPPKESNATKKRNQRRAWYLQTVLKKPKADGSPMA